MRDRGGLGASSQSARPPKLTLHLVLGLLEEPTHSLTDNTTLTFSAAALEPVGPVVAFGPVLAGGAGALVDVDLTHGASEPWDIQTQR